MPTIGIWATRASPALGRAFEIADERRQVLASVRWRGPAVELHFDVAAGPVPRQTRTAVVADVFKLLDLAADVALHICEPLARTMRGTRPACASDKALGHAHIVGRFGARRSTARPSVTVTHDGRSLRPRWSAVTIR